MRTSGAVAVTIIVILGFMGVVFLLITKPIAVTPDLKEILLVLLGMLSMKFGDSVMYWIGSSSGSAAKDQQQAAAQEKLQATVTDKVEKMPP